MTSKKLPARPFAVSALAAAAVVALPLLAGSAAAETYKPAGSTSKPAAVTYKPAASTYKPAAATYKPAGGHKPATVDSVSLPGGFAPEGITDDGHRTLFVGSLGAQRGSAANGAIYAADVRTGAGRVVVPGAEGRITVGITYQATRDGGRIWAAGGATGAVRLHDARTGRLIRSWTVPGAAFLNDVVVTPKGVYVTDSAAPQLTVIPFGKHGTLPAQPTVLPVTGVTYQATGANLNGIVAYNRGRDLVAVQSNTGKLFRLDPRTGAATEIALTGGPLLNGDGLEQARGSLYVMRNRDNLLAEVQLDRRLTRATVVRGLTDPQFDVPSTVTYAAGFMWAVNARFTTNPVTPETPFTVERVDIR